MNKKDNNLRKALANKIFTNSDVPVIVYGSVILAMIVLWFLQDQYELAGDFFIELFGVAFTLFIIDILLVRSKSKRWKIVHDDVDYLISRLIDRMREGIAYRCFKFIPDLEESQDVDLQRTNFLESQLKEELSELSKAINKEEFFTLDTYQYLNERANDVWEIINMKYAEFLSPVLVSELIHLHACLKDMAICNVQYRKSDRYGKNDVFYKQKALEDLSRSTSACIGKLVMLHQQGFSENIRK